MAKLAPIFNTAQFINGVPAVGAKLFTYAAGSSTKQTTYTDEDGTTPQSNPIILNARGEPDSPIWLSEGQAYKFVFSPSTDSDPPTSPIRTVDDVTGIGDTTVALSQWVDSGVTPTYVSATQFTVPGDQTSAFVVNRRIKATVTAGTVYGNISVSAYTSLTTVTVVLDSGSLDAGLSAVQLGLITPDNTSLPKIPDWVTPEMFEDNSVTARALSDSALGFSLINGTLTASVASNALTIAIKTKAGEDPSSDDPVLCVFRNATLATGDYVVRSITAATSLVISSGSRLGTTSAVQSTLQVLVIDNAGTVELAVVNNSGALQLDEASLISTTAEGGAGEADSGNVIYSTTARSSVPYRNVGYVVSTQATSGTWATFPTQIQLYSRPPAVNGSLGLLLASGSVGTGTTLDIPNIPSWATEIEINLDQVSMNGTGIMNLILGDAGGFETTGYVSAGSSAGGTINTSTTSFQLYGVIAAADDVTGTIYLRRGSGNSWFLSFTSVEIGTDRVQVAAGKKTLSDTLTQIRFGSNSGTQSFDEGTYAVRVK